MSERTEQQKTLLALSAAFAPHGVFWTADVGTGVPYSAIKALPKRIKDAYARGGILAVLDLIRRLPVLSWGIEGGADIQGCCMGLWFGIEMKTATGRQRESQKVFQRNIERAGGVYFIARTAQEAVDGVRAGLEARGLVVPPPPAPLPARGARAARYG